MSNTIKAVYTVRCTKAWDGSNGVEWTCGAAVYKSHNSDTYKVFEDDGEGNGNKLAEFRLELLAKRYADLYVRFIESGGYSDSREAEDMAILVRLHGL